jgi:hypothetical protein
MAVCIPVTSRPAGDNGVNTVNGVNEATFGPHLQLLRRQATGLPGGWAVQAFLASFYHPSAVVMVDSKRQCFGVYPAQVPMLKTLLREERLPPEARSDRLAAVRGAVANALRVDLDDIWVHIATHGIKIRSHFRDPTFAYSYSVCLAKPVPPHLFEAFLAWFLDGGSWKRKEYDCLHPAAIPRKPTAPGDQVEHAPCSAKTERDKPPEDPSDVRSRLGLTDMVRPSIAAGACTSGMDLVVPGCPTRGIQGRDTDGPSSPQPRWVPGSASQPTDPAPARAATTSPSCRHPTGDVSLDASLTSFHEPDIVPLPVPARSATRKRKLVTHDPNRSLKLDRKPLPPLSNLDSVRCDDPMACTGAGTAAPMPRSDTGLPPAVTAALEQLLQAARNVQVAIEQATGNLGHTAVDCTSCR